MNLVKRDLTAESGFLIEFYSDLNQWCHIMVVLIENTLDVFHNLVSVLFYNFHIVTIIVIGIFKSRISAQFLLFACTTIYNSLPPVIKIYVWYDMKNGSIKVLTMHMHRSNIPKSPWKWRRSFCELNKVILTILYFTLRQVGTRVYKYFSCYSNDFNSFRGIGQRSIVVYFI